MNAYTLISSIGTGMYKDEGGYRKTTYHYADGETQVSSLFLETLLKTQKWDIRKVLLVGTYTSSWDMLIPDEGNGDPDLWITLKDECKSPQGISEASLRVLEAKMPQWYKIPFVFKVHASHLDSDNVEDIFGIYKTISSELAEGTDILFDITHGFRSMPILIYQALQYDMPRFPKRRIHLIYGEYIDKEKISYVRDLSKYWDFHEISAAITLFEEKLDGESLAEKIKPYWEAGGKCLIRLSAIVQCNLSFQVPDVLRQINNAFKSVPDDVPHWVQDVCQGLRVLYNRLQADSVSLCLRKYSKLLEEKRLITQGVIALQMALETAITEKYASEDTIGDYDWWQEYGDDFYKKEKNKLSWEYNNALYKIENLRNAIAHGGNRDKKTKEYPSIANLPSLLKQGNRAADQLFAQLAQGASPCPVPSVS
jgi:CRISPR-associated Csx2 family protein